MAKREKRDRAIDQAVLGLIEGGAEKKPKAVANPLGVKLEPDELQLVAEIAEQLGVSRHNLLQYAVREMLRRWKAGERPQVQTKEVKFLE